MESSKGTEMPKASEISKSDIEWLHQTIDIKNLGNLKWTSAQRARAITNHLTKKTIDCRLNDKNSEGNTALHLLAMSKNYAAIEALLMCGADVNELNMNGETPITRSSKCPDYTVGFQFFRHLHKLFFLGQPVHEANRNWYCNAWISYKKNYPRGYITPFVHDPSLAREAIDSIIEGGDDAIKRYYEEELQKIEIYRMDQKPTKLIKVVNITDQLDVPIGRLKKLNFLIKRRDFHRKFPLFGFMIKQKYWQCLERYKMTKPTPTIAKCSSGATDEATTDFIVNRDESVELNSDENVEKIRNLLEKLPTRRSL